MKKLEKFEMILKICNFKKGIGIESEKLCKQVRVQIVWKQVKDTAQELLKKGIKFYSIYYHYSDCIWVIVDNIAVRIGIANALEFISIL